VILKQAMKLMMPRVAAATLLVAAAGACSIGRGIGRDVGTGIQESEPDLNAFERRLADSMASYLGGQLQVHVLDQARTTWNGMRSDAVAGMDTILTQTADAVRGELNAAVRDLLAQNLGTLEAGGEALVARLADSLTARLHGALADALSSAADSAGYAAVLGATRGIDAELTPALLTMLDSLRSALPEEIRQALHGTGRVVERQVGVHPLIVGLIALALVGALVGNWLSNAAHRHRLERLLASSGARQQDASA